MKISSFQLFREKIFQTGILCEKLQIKMYKMILGVNTKVTNSAVKAELGRFPLHITIFSTILKYLFHLLNDHDENLFLMNALHTSISLNSRRVRSWFSMFAHLLKLDDFDFNNLTVSRDLRKNSWIKLYSR